MASIRGALRFSRDLSIIVFLFVVFVIGLAVQTLLRKCKDRLPEPGTVRETVWNWIWRPT